jgi:ATP-dependent RNA helicase RhlE
MTFQRLNLIEPILRALKEEGYETPTPIQAQAIPHALEGRDLLACAQTGTGKTAAFAIPILQNLHEQHISRNKPKLIKSLILTPTRELAIQISESFSAYGRHMRLRNLVIFGGVSQNPQVDDLRKGVDVLVATPGRLLDLMNQGIVSLQHIELFVLDEADRMLDMGFIHDVRRVIKALPQKRQTLFFSATMPHEIAQLANDILTDPVKVAVTPVSSTAEAIEQSVFFVDKKKKKNLLIHLLKSDGITSALVFTRTKHGANRVVKDLTKAGVNAQAIHGNKSQTARQNALNNFKTGDIRVLVATDIAARGIDLEELSHVINFDLPNIPETYVHRIGRTGRAGASGIAFSFCDEEEKAYLKDIQKLINRKIPVVEQHPFPLGTADEPDETPALEERKNGRREEFFAAERKPSRQGSGRSKPSLSAEGNQEKKQREMPGKATPPGEAGEKKRSNRRSSRRKNRNNRRGEDVPQTTPIAEKNQDNRQSLHSRNRNEPRLEDAPKKATATEKNFDDRRSSIRENEQKPHKDWTFNLNDSEKTDHADEKKREWSSIFSKPSSGRKGFVIKSDRDEQSKKRKDKHPFRRKKS